ncbi:MAG: UvrD-helicase domain-containing protein [Bacteroidota bacterium]
MPSGFDRETDIRLPSVTVLTASAGAGKTYALTHRYAQLLLSNKIRHNALQSVLAITFTNNAAAEMKQRILMLLKLASFGDEKTLRELSTLVSMDQSDIQLKSARLVGEILDNFSDFQVKTVDSFMSTVFKSSSLEYGYHPDFEILLSTDAFFDRAFDLFSKEVKHNSAQARVVEEIVELVTENRKGEAGFLWNPYVDLTGQIKKIYKAIASQTKPLNSVNSSAILSTLREQIKTQAVKVEGEIKKSGLAASSLFADDLELIRIDNIQALIERKLRESPVNKPKGKVEKAAYDRWIEEIEHDHRHLNELLQQFFLHYAESYYQPYAEAYILLQNTVEKLKKQSGRIFIDDINRTLAGHLDVEIVPEIYFKIGETIYHYLIDEFQDTSQIQWKNLFPLIEESLSKGGSLFVVGDTKQSIYGFRDADWRIMKELTETNLFPSAHHEVNSLDLNYRSFEKIVAFTKQVFHTIIPGEGFRDEAAASGLSTYEQHVTPEHDGKGYVEVDVVQEGEDEPAEKHILMNIVDECRSRGYRFNEIAILTPNNTNVIEVSGWLNEHGVPIISHSTLDVRRRKSAGEIIALLRFLDSPVDDLSFAAFILGNVFSNAIEKRKGSAGLNDIRQLIIESRARNRDPLYTAFRDRFKNVWDQYFEHLFNVVGYLPLYDLVSEAYKIFDVFNTSPNEEASLVKLLEVIKVFEQQGANTMKNFLEYSEDETDDAWKIDVPKDIDALQVMTVHKAKGIEFPVVIVLLYDNLPRGKSFLLRENEDSISILKVNKKIAENVEQIGKLLKEEHFRDTVDAFNKLYVAFTRAEKEMYVVGVYKKEVKEPTKFLPQTGYGPAQKPAVAASVVQKENIFVPFHHTVRKPLFVQAYETVGRQEAKRGDFIHRVFSYIEFIEDDVDSQLNAAIERARCEMLAPDSLEELKKVMRQSLDEPNLRKCFIRMEKRSILLERELSNRDGALYRADRIIVDPENVTVVDFKTGGDESESDYILQVRNYMAILKEIYPDKEAKGYIAYVDLKRTRSVS